MRRDFVKISIVMVVAFVLLYYSVAWAVLRCCHDEDRPGYRIAWLYHDAVQLTIDCIGSDYHTESMAGSSSSSQLQWSTPDRAHRVNNLLTFRTISTDETNDVWLRAVFEDLSSLSFPISLPRYLSLSTLRI